ncbi:hypothetical protein SLE2022_147950 [Rubroshorea leprosula]
MSVRFKFRSAPNFDSVDIGGLPSISVRDLKSKIIHNKKLNICQDSDLVFSDHFTGQEYVDEDVRIPCGSSVIIKRVPAGTVPSNKVHGSSLDNFATIDVDMVKASLPVKAETIDFDDFGAELCPVSQSTLSGIDPDIDKKYFIGNERTNIEMRRCHEPPTIECQELDGTDIREAIPRDHAGFDDKAPETKSRPSVEPNIRFSKAVDASSPDLQNTDFPSELKCYLCNTYFKNAVMIPCCQHSFCEICISEVLVEKARCPKCFSTKCSVEDLLPNVSLRCAIEHFLESRLLMSGSENALHGYAPDGESGIQAKDVSCAISILQKEHHLPPSSSATGRGSNQVAIESIGGTDSPANPLAEDEKIKLLPLSLKLQQVDQERDGSAHHVELKNGPENSADFADFQGESQPIHEEAESNIKTKGTMWVKGADEKKNFVETGRYKKGDRTCYMCGSPDHLIRDCPVASSPHPLFQRGHAMFPGPMPGYGYGSPCWNGHSFPHGRPRPFPITFGNAGMMPFNATMIPVTPFSVPTFMPSMFGGSPTYRGFMGMGGTTTPVKDNINHHLSPSELDVQDYEKRQKFSSEKIMSRQPSFDDNDDTETRCQFEEVERLQQKKSRDRERSVGHSDDSFTQRSNGKCRHRHNPYDDIYLPDERHDKSSRSSIVGRDHSSHHHSERSRSEIEDLPSTSSGHSGEKYKHCHRSSKKQNDRREQGGSDSSWDHHPSNKEKDVKRKRINHDVERQKEKHHNHSDSGLKQSLSAYQKEKGSEKHSSHSSRRSGHNAKSGNDELSHDRLRMVSRSDEDAEEDYRYHKRKRVY